MLIILSFLCCEHKCSGARHRILTTPEPLPSHVGQSSTLREWPSCIDGWQDRRSGLPPVKPGAHAGAVNMLQAATAHSTRGAAERRTLLERSTTRASNVGFDE